MQRTTLIVGSQEGARRKLIVPDGVVRYKIRTSKNATVCYLKYPDRMEKWYLEAVGDDQMRPVICECRNIKGWGCRKKVK